MLTSPYRLLAVPFIILLSLGCPPLINAQVPGPGSSLLPPEQLESLVLPKLDNDVLRAEELALRRAGRAPRFARAIPVQISPLTHGRWDKSGDLAIWRLRLRSAGAYSLNLGFTQYRMPAGGALHIYDPQQKKITGPFTPADNESHNQLWTPIFPGDELVIEVRVPSRLRNELQLELAYVNHDFLDFLALNSGSCNLDIVCDSEDGWELIAPFRDASRSVGLVSIEGTLLCTGFLVNNTYKDCTPYFLTAYHCEIRPDNDQTVVVYWNFENSTCREPNSVESGGEGDGQLNDFNTGSVYRAGWNNSDFCLLELDDPVSETANAHFAGWSAEIDLPIGEVACVHHPFTDEKRISISEESTHLGYWGSGNPAEAGNHLIVPKWTVGTTQGGSSGGPLFDSDGKAIGQLHGGDAACGNDLYDAFGRLYDSWEGGGTADSRLKDWLDPAGWNSRTLNGMDQGACGYWVRASFSSGTVCAGDSDTLLIQRGPAYDTTAVGGQPFEIPQELNIQASVISDTNQLYAQYLWSTNTDTPPGDYIFETYTAFDTNYFRLSVFDQFPQTPALLSPGNGAANQGLQVAVSWSSQGSRQDYALQLATDPAFANLVSELAIHDDTTTVLAALTAGAVYYWRVKTTNVCGESEWSETFSFQTAVIECFTLAASDGPVTIPVNSSTISSEIEVTASGLLADIEIVDLDIEHSWIGDLSIVLRAPSGKEIALMDRPGFPNNLYGCDGRNIFVSFNQNSGASYQIMENLCGSIPPAISGTFQPIQSLHDLVGESVQGTWTLIVRDNADEDGGELQGWQLNLCTVPETIPLLSKVSEAYLTCADTPLEIDVAISEAFNGESIQFAIEELPAGSTVTYSANPASPGDTVRITLSDLNLLGPQTLTLNATDGGTTTSLPLDIEVRSPPTIPSLLSPLDASELNEQEIVFDWNELPDVISYQLEIATDVAFSNIIISEVVTASEYTLEMPEQEGAFFWRVIALNDCGEISSEISTFTFTTTGTSELENGQSVQVFPNPFSERVRVQFTRVLADPVQLRLIDVRGRLLFSDEMQAGEIDRLLPLEYLPSGVYLLELQYRGRRIVERLVK